MRRVTILFTALLFAMSMLATPAVADHDHNLNNPGGCIDIPVGEIRGQYYHGADDPGLKFHGAAHVDAAVEHYDNHDDFGGNIGILGQGNSPVWVGGDPC